MSALQYSGAMRTDFDYDRSAIDGLAAGDCAAGFGKIIDSRAGPRIDDRPTIEIRYEPERGRTPYRAQTALLQRDGAGYRLLWRHGGSSHATGRSECRFTPHGLGRRARPCAS